MAAPSACPLWLLPSLHPPPAIAPRHSAILASASRRRHPGGNRLLRCKRSILGLDNRSALRVRIVAQRGIRMAATMLVRALWHRVEKPDSVSLEAITSADQFDEILAENQESNTSTVIEWMAAWCRKCIYLKPKLEKLAAEYYPNVRFYYVDVNTVPQTLVRRAEVTKMPTIQLWKDGVKKAEVVGGHKAWLVLDEVREMLHGT